MIWEGRRTDQSDHLLENRGNLIPTSEHGIALFGIPFIILLFRIDKSGLNRSEPPATSVTEAEKRGSNRCQGFLLKWKKWNGRRIRFECDGVDSGGGGSGDGGRFNGGRRRMTRYRQKENCSRHERTE